MILAPSRSWTQAPITITHSSRPIVSKAMCRFRAVDLLARVIAARDRPTVSAPRMEAQSMTAALGAATLSPANGTLSRNASRICGVVPVFSQRVKYLSTVECGGKPAGSARHLIPLSTT